MAGLEYLTKNKVLKIWQMLVRVAREAIVAAYESIQTFERILKLNDNQRRGDAGLYQ